MNKDVEQILIEKLKDGLLNREFELKDKFPVEIPQIVAEAFIVNAFSNFEGVEEFDVKPVKQGNVILVNITDATNRTLLGVLLPMKIIENKINITDVLVSINNMK